MNAEITFDRSLLNPACVLMDVDITSPQEAFQLAADALHSAHGINAATLVRRLSLREGRGSTAVGSGIAIPHADSWGLTKPRAAFVRSTRAMGFFQMKDERPVREVLILVAPRPAMAIHHSMLSHYHALLGNIEFREQLQACVHARQVWKLFRENEWNSNAHDLAPRARHNKLARRNVREVDEQLSG